MLKASWQPATHLRYSLPILLMRFSDLYVTYTPVSIISLMNPTCYLRVANHSALNLWSYEYANE